LKRKKVLKTGSTKNKTSKLESKGSIIQEFKKPIKQNMQ